MKNTKQILTTITFIFILWAKNACIFAQSQGIPPSITEEITAILMKPVPSGSTLRYENLVKYLKKLDIENATRIIDQIEHKTPFGQNFYHRMSHSTVDKKILPLLKDIEGGAYLEGATFVASKPVENADKSKPKTANVKAKPKPKMQTADVVQQKVDINSGNIFLANKWPFVVAVPKTFGNKSATEDDIKNAVFLNVPDGISFEKKDNFLWQLSYDSKANFLSLLLEKEHYLVPSISAKLFQIDIEKLIIGKVSTDKLMIRYPDNIKFETRELIFAITKNDRLPSDLELSEAGGNNWALIFKQKGAFESLLEKLTGYDLSAFEESFAKKVMALNK